MSIEKLKELFGSNEVMLELVEVEDGQLVLRNGRGDESKHLIKIDIHEDMREVLGEQVHTIAQQMVHVVLVNLLDQQLGELHAQIVDEKPKHFS
ncbi:MAG: hypothetical protein Q4D05_06645 [Acinetobacter sp.]|nr:hypothetical protein [Acinetobacter sp.]